MKNCTLAFTGFLLCILSSISSNQLYAQWQPVHDANGKVITGGGRTYDEARRKAEQEKIQREAAEERRKNTYNTTNGIQSKSNSANAPKADHPDYGKYDFRGTVDDNGLRIVFLKEKWGLVSKDDKEILPLVYDRVVYKGDGWYEIIFGTKSGFADKNGHEVIPCQFDFIESIFNSEGLATVRKNGNTYFINKEGKAALSSKQNYVYHGFGNRYVEGLVCVSLKDITGKEKYGFLDSNGILKIPLIYDNALNFQNGMAYVQIGASWGTIDKDGKAIVPIAYYKLNSTGDLFIASTWKDNFGVIDRTGAVMIPLIYEASGRFSEGCIKMKFKGEWGFVDSVSGKEITQFVYNSANDFSEGLAAVSKRDDRTYDKYGFINKAGEEIIPFVYQEVINKGFTQGFAGVLQNGYWGFIDKNQKTAVPFI